MSQTNQYWVEQTAQYVARTYGRYPLAFERGEGCRLWDVEGNEYLDMVAGLAVANLGHAHPAITEAICAQAGKLLHTSNLYQIPHQAELAKKLVEKSFGDKVFFCNSGAEANEAALKLARRFGAEHRDGRYEIITASGGFHGRTYGAVSATAQEKYHTGFYPLLPGFRHVPYGDIAAVDAAVGESTVAVMLEPIQGEGGVNVPPADYLRRVRELCDERGLLLIFDEVQVGTGRTGKLWAYEHEGIAPDMMTLAKGLAGGVPIGALVMTDALAASFVPGTHASTFGGNPLATAAGLAAFAHIADEDFLAEVREKGEYLLRALREMQRRNPVIRDVRGRGLIVGAELDRPGAPVVQAAMERGVLLNCARETVIRFVPPLIVTHAELDRALNVLEECLHMEAHHG